MLDTLMQVETPEGIALRLRPAGMLPRAAAWALDLAIRLAVLWMLSILLLALGETGMGLYLIALFAVFWIYPVLFEVLRDGQTIGKKAMGLRVVHANGTPVTWIASIVRNLMRVVDMLPLVYGFGFIAGLIDPRGRRLGDMVAGTLVVHVEKPQLHIAAPNVPVLYTPVALSSDEKAAIVAFAERAQQLTAERQRELADILPMLTDANGNVAVQRLLGIANAFLGRR
jgi:uncharacterized RDD family membrane protein YckC